MIGEKNRNFEGLVHHPNKLELVKISGVITKLVTTRDDASFVFTENDKTPWELLRFRPRWLVWTASRQR